MKSKYAPTLTDDTALILAYFVEECGEALQAAGKSARWGWHSVNPELPPEQQISNVHWLLNELDDLEYAMRLLRLKMSSADATRVKS